MLTAILVNQVFGATTWQAKVHGSRCSCFDEGLFMLCVCFEVGKYAIKFVTSELVSCSTGEITTMCNFHGTPQMSINNVILDMYLSQFAFLLNL